ncbi:MAG: hypothetical protein LUH02_06810, partial [Erysipelotrichaceae bacterium]|nr:hypothetical protein [Erysipelotrichaceae bacterium]
DYDVFNKWDKYKNQYEWRLVVNNGIPSKKELRIDIGDLSDIIIKVHRNELVNTLKQLLVSQVIYYSDINDYYGNISREEMRRNFCNLGNNKGYLNTTLVCPNAKNIKDRRKYLLSLLKN